MSGVLVLFASLPLSPRYDTYDEVMKILPQLPRPVLISFLRPGRMGQFVQGNRAAAVRRSSTPSEVTYSEYIGRDRRIGGLSIWAKTEFDQVCVCCLYRTWLTLHLVPLRSDYLSFFCSQTLHPTQPMKTVIFQGNRGNSVIEILTFPRHPPTLVHNPDSGR